MWGIIPFGQRLLFLPEFETPTPFTVCSDFYCWLPVRESSLSVCQHKENTAVCIGNQWHCHTWELFYGAVQVNRCCLVCIQYCCPSLLPEINSYNKYVLSGIYSQVSMFRMAVLTFSIFSGFLCPYCRVNVYTLEQLFVTNSLNLKGSCLLQYVQ